MGISDRRKHRGDPMFPAYVRPKSTSSNFQVNIDVGFGVVPIGWDAASEEEATASFLTFLQDESSVQEIDGWAVPRPGWRRVHVKFHGVAKTLTFRPDWIAGFTIEKG